MTEVSVILTVYNGEAFLSRSISSLLRQTLRDIEILCVDDCSTDGTLGVLNAYARDDERVRVIHLDHNVGLAKARNEALRHATGRYVCTLDADDWYSDDALEKAVAVFREHPDTDCVLFQLTYAHDHPSQDYRFPMKRFDALSGVEAMKESINWQGVHGWYLIKTEIHKRYPFDTTRRLYSDENTVRYHFRVAREVRQCDGTYFYYQNPVSETHRVNPHYFDHMPAYEHLLTELTTMGVDDETRRMLHGKLWLSVIDCYYYARRHKHDFSGETLRAVRRQIKAYRHTIDFSMVSQKLKKRPGYMPVRCSWRLFLIQEEVYFTLRGIFKDKRLEE